MLCSSLGYVCKSLLDFRADGPSQVAIRTTMKGTILLPCPVTGFPQPRIKWRYPGGHIEDLFTSLLSITVQKRGDFGEYSCSARGKEFTFKLEEYKGPSPTPTSISCEFARVENWAFFSKKPGLEPMLLNMADFGKS